MASGTAYLSGIIAELNNNFVLMTEKQAEKFF
jgi:hypothetical protein